MAMAEAIAIIGLVSSVASLVEISAKVISRLHEFTSNTSQIPVTFRSLPIQLPLLTVALHRIQTQAEVGRLPVHVTNALRPVVDNTFEQVSAVQIFLSGILPADDASKLDRALKGLKSLSKEKKVQQALEKIHKNNEILRLDQITQHVDTSNLILEELSKLTTASNLAAGAFGRDALLSLARATTRTISDELSPQTQSMLSNGNRGLLFRFSQLPIAAQENFIAQQEEQVSL